MEGDIKVPDGVNSLQMVRNLLLENASGIPAVRQIYGTAESGAGVV
jgi:hypothetical protein